MFEFSFLLALGLVLFYAFWSGFSDGPSILAASISSRMVHPKVAMTLVMIGEFAGSIAGVAVAGFISSKMINAKGLPIWAFTVAMACTIAWSYYCYTRGIPISETHSLIGSLVGVSLAIGGVSRIQTNNVLTLVAFTVVGPILAFLFARMTSKVLGFIAELLTKKAGDLTFKVLNYGSILSMSFAHGNNDTQKPIGMIFLLLGIVGGTINNETNQFYARVVCIALALIGILAGGRKILYTLTETIGKVNIYQGVNSQITSTVILEFFTKLALPVSTTHIMTAGMAGSRGSNKKVQVRSEIIKDIALSWIVTIPVTVCLGFLITKGLNLK